MKTSPRSFGKSVFFYPIQSDSSYSGLSLETSTMIGILNIVCNSFFVNVNNYGDYSVAKEEYMNERENLKIVR